MVSYPLWPKGRFPQFFITSSWTVSWGLKLGLDVVQRSPTRKMTDYPTGVTVNFMWFSKLQRCQPWKTFRAPEEREAFEKGLHSQFPPWRIGL